MQYLPPLGGGISLPTSALGTGLATLSLRTRQDSRQPPLPEFALDHHPTRGGTRGSPPPHCSDAGGPLEGSNYLIGTHQSHRVGHHWGLTPGQMPVDGNRGEGYVGGVHLSALGQCWGNCLNWKGGY